MNEIDPRDFGSLEARVAELENKVDNMSKKLDTILVTLTEAKGGWRMLMGVAGAAAAGATALQWAAQHMSLK
jgi:predicted secreted protein